MIANDALVITNASIADTGSYKCTSENTELSIHVLVEITVQVEMTLRVINLNFTEALENNTSPEYIETETRFIQSMDEVHLNHTPGYNRTEVLGFTNGSVKVDFRLIIIIVTSDPSNTTNDTKAEATRRVVQVAKKGFIPKGLIIDKSPEAFTIQSPPPEPGEVQILEATSDQISVQWDVSSDAAYYKVTNYVVKYWVFGVKDQEANAVEENLPHTAKNFKLKDLESDTSYSIQVAAKNKHGFNFNDPKTHTTLKKGLALWIIIVIVVASVLVLVVIIALIVYKCRQNRHDEEEHPRFGGLQSEAIRMNKMGTPDRDLEYTLEGATSVKTLAYAYTNRTYQETPGAWEEIPRENVKLLNELGSGAFGVVFKANFLTDTDDVLSCAVKTLKANATNEEIRDLYNELEIMVNVGYHPNLVNLIGACTQGGELLVVLELAENGSLLELLQKSRQKTQYSESTEGGLSAELKWSISTDVARGMVHLAKHRCIHRDLAARNVLLGKDYVAKVSDYGMARDVYEQLMYKKETQGKLPVKWMALESLETYTFTIESDVWSFGVLLWEIESGGMKPYAGLSTTELIAKLKSGYRMQKPSACTPETYQIMTHCWDRDPKARPTFEQLVIRMESVSVA